MRFPIFGLIAPHPPIMVQSVGGPRSSATTASVEAMHRAARCLRHFAPETIVLISPHAPTSSNRFVVDDAAAYAGSLADFGDPRVVQFAGDSDLAHEIVDRLRDSGLPAISRSEDDELRSGWLDHASLVPLRFLDDEGCCSLVVVSVSSLPYETHRKLGAVAAEAAQALGRRVAFVASGDLSHRLTEDAPAGYSPNARHLDATIVGLVEQGRFETLAEIDADLVFSGGECGLRSIIALGGYCCEDPAPARLLAYEGPWGVGYLTALIGRAALETDDALHHRIVERGCKGGCAGEDESEIVRLARASIVARLTEAEPNPHPHLSDAAYPKEAGAFVSLHRAGLLRGCIGTSQPSQSTLAAEVASNAIQAALHDPRFLPLKADELDDLEISVDVVHQPESCEFDDLEPRRYGVIVNNGQRTGLLLPDLVGVDDALTQVSIAKRKAGIGENELVGLMRFRVDRYT